MKKITFVSLCLLGAIAGDPPANCAVLTTVPMGGTMLHVTISYQAGPSSLTAVVDPVQPQLTPLDVTNPNDSFTSTDPWFQCLDPSSCGLAFNRQYGLVMGSGTDPIPLQMGIWVRCLSATPGLGFYYYRSTAPKAWEPMFGSAGSTNVWPWSMSMFHPAVTAPATNTNHHAEFEAFAVDLNTGLEIPSIARAAFTLTWNALPSARPVLQLGPDLVLYWPATATNYVLEASANLNPGDWSAVTNSAVVNGERCTLRLAPADPRQFYRLRRQ